MSMFGHQVLEEGMSVTWHGQKGEIQAINVNRGFIVVEFADGEFITKKMPDVYLALAKAELVVDEVVKAVVLESIQTPEQVALYQQIEDYVTFLDEQPNPRSRTTIKKIIPLVAKMRNKPVNEVSDSKVYRWYRDYVEAGRKIAPLVVKPKKKRSSKFDDVALDYFDEVIWEEYLTFNGPTPEAVWDVYKERHHNLSDPDKKRITRIGRTRFLEMIKELDIVEVTRARQGDEAVRRLVKVRDKLFFPEHPLQRIEVDAVHLNIGLLNNDKTKYVGMPIIYFAFDVFTRAIVGYFVGFGDTKTKTNGLKRSEKSSHVRALLEHVLFKAEASAYRNVKSTWPLMGAPIDVVCDAGSAFNNKEIDNFIKAFKGNRVLTQAGSPWKKPFVERFNRTLRDQFAKKIGSYVGRRVNQEVGSVNVRELAKYNVEEFKELLETYILDIYHHTKHGGLGGRTPFSVAKENNYKKMYDIPLSLADISSRMGVKEERKLQPNGDILFDHLKYNSAETQLLYRELSARSKKNFEVSILVRDDDISTISVINPLTNKAFVVPCLDVQHSISRSEFKAEDASEVVKDDINPTMGNHEGVKAIMKKADVVKAAIDKYERAEKKGTMPKTPDVRELGENDIDEMRKSGGGVGTHVYEQESEQIPEPSGEGLSQTLHFDE